MTNLTVPLSPIEIIQTVADVLRLANNEAYQLDLKMENFAW